MEAGLGCLISQLPQEIRREIVRKIRPLGMMIARHVLLGHAIATTSFGIDPDIYRHGLEFFVWCYENIRIQRLEHNVRRFGNATIIKWLCENWFVALEPDSDLRDKLIRKIYRAITIDYDTQPCVVVFGDALRDSLHDSLIHLLYNAYIGLGCDSIKDIIEYAEGTPEPTPKLIGMHRCANVEQIKMFIDAIEQINIKGCHYLIKSDVDYKLLCDVSDKLIIFERKPTVVRIGYVPDSVWIEKYVLNYVDAVDFCCS